MMAENDLPEEGIRPYPWSEDDGLCDVLRDPSLWSLVFDLEDRHAVKRAAKKEPMLISLKLPSVTKVKDDALMGQLSVELLASIQGRRCLQKEFKSIRGCTNRTWNEFLANRLYHRALSDKGYNIPELDEVCIERGPEYWCLVPSKFSDWLESSILEPSDFRILALYACAFAILQPKEASEILCVLLEINQTEFQGFLTDKTIGEIVQEIPPLDEVPKVSKSSMVSLEPELLEKEEERKEIDQKQQVDGFSVIELLQSFRGQVESLSVDKLRMYSELLRSNLKQSTEILEELSELTAKTTGLFNKINQSNWLKSKLKTDMWSLPHDQTNIATALDELHEVEGRLSFLIELNDQANVLAERVCEKPSPSINPVGMGIDNLTMAFQQLVDCLKVKVGDISRRDRHTDMLLSQLVTLNVDGRVKLLENTEMSTWLEFSRFLIGGEARTETARKYEQLFGQIRLLGPILVYLWTLDASSVINFIRDSIWGENEIAWKDKIGLLAYLRVDQLEQVGVSSSELVNEVAETIFALCIASGKLDGLEYLEPLVYEKQLNPICCLFYRAALNAKRNGIVIETYHDLDPTRISEENYDRKSRVDTQRQHILDIVEEPPGMGGIYGKLRVIAKLKFLTPLKQYLEKGSTDDLYRKWSSYGNLDQMVTAVETYMRSKSGGRMKSLDHSQEKQTRNYLENFDRELSKLRALEEEDSIEAKQELIEACVQLRKQAETERGGSCDKLLYIIETVLGKEDKTFSDNIGQLCSEDGLIALVQPKQSGLILPTMIASWPEVISTGEVPILNFICDLLAHELNEEPRNTVDAFKLYLERREFKAANTVAEGNVELEKMFSEKMQELRSNLLADYSETLSAAKAMRDDDELIDYWLGEVELALETFEYDEVAKLLPDLEELVTEYHRIKEDPKRRGLIAFLSETDVSFDKARPIEELEAYVDTYRNENTAKRQHIIQLIHIVDDGRLPNSLRQHWTSFGNRIDHPRAWLPEELSGKLAAAIKIFEKYIGSKVQQREAAPEIVDEIVDGLRQWVPNQIHIAVELEKEDRELELERIFKLAEDIEGFCFYTVILDAIGASGVSERLTLTALSVSPQIKRTDLVVSNASLERPDMKQRNIEIVRRIRQTLQKNIDKETDVGDVGPSQLLKACKDRNWEEVRIIAANLSRRTNSHDRIDDIEAVYAIARAYSCLDFDEDEQYLIWENACLSSLLTRDDLKYYFSEGFTDQFSTKAVLAIIQGHGGIESRQSIDTEELARIVDYIQVCPTSDDSYKRIAKLFTDSSQLDTGGKTVSVSSMLAENLWEVLKGQPSVGKHRSSLLMFLCRLKLVDSLKHLVSVYVKPYESLVMSCINAFLKAKIDNAAVPGAIQLATAAQRQMKGKRNAMPWLLLFNKLSINVQECLHSLSLNHPTATWVNSTKDNEAVLEIGLVPSIGDPPDKLFIDLGSGQNNIAHISLIEEDEVLLSEKVVTVNVPRQMFDDSGDYLHLTYRIHGLSVQGNNIEMPGRWDFQERRQKVEISLEQIRKNWPGASGEPVGIHRGYYGREREMKAVESHLIRSDRPGSVMVFGQRRIGKTSFLREMVRSHPPGKGNICGAFVDISGLSFLNEPGYMQMAFFNRIIEALESESDNLLIRKAVEDHSGHTKIRRLAKGIKPRTGIANALEKLADRLMDFTDGVISRIAFFVDEFDKFVKPLLEGQESEVDALMWSLRQIVQRSEKVALVLAGSGIQRLLVDEPKDALFGSIPQIVLEPFSWDFDCKAIKETFMPTHISENLCAKEDFEEVARRAFELCGGFPWFLSMLGYSTAIVSGGQKVTPSFLNYVVDKMVGKSMETMTVTIDAGKFYRHSVFESLDVLSLREKAVAKSILAQISQYTSAEHKWIKISAVVEVPDLLGLVEGKERDLIAAMGKLEKERVVERNEYGEVRISIPLTARALSEDALAIREECINDLRLL